MSQSSIGHEQSEEEILHVDVSDEELERAAGIGKQNAAPPTAPYAIICIPFGRT